MRKPHRFQNQKLVSGLSQPTTTESNPTKNNNGALASEIPHSLIENTIHTSIAIRPTREEVAAMAYQIYLKEGRPQGRDLQHWLEAEAQLAAVSPMEIRTEMTMKTEVTVKNEIGSTARPDKARAKLAV